MKNTIILLCSFVFVPLGHAVLGPSFKFHERPHSVCAIELYNSDAMENMSEVCSAVVIGPQEMLTAAHCTPKLPHTPHKIICRGEQYAKVERVIQNDNVQLDLLRRDESEHRYDTAILKTEEVVDIPNIKLATTYQKTRELLDNTKTCGIFGFGGFEKDDREKGHSTSTILNPKQIQFDGDLIRVDGFKGRANGLVEPGDSGGSLACQEPETQKWIHFAQVSGRTMQGVSLLAPTYLIEAQLEKHDLVDLPLQAQEIQETWEKQDHLIETQHCLKLLERSDASKEDLETFSECQSAKDQFFKERVSQNIETKVRLATYSLVELDQSGDQILLSQQRDDARLYKHTNPFSTVDHVFNQFIIKEIRGDNVIGDLRIFGYSESFPCRENILCDGGEFKNVKTSIKNLTLPLLK